MLYLSQPPCDTPSCLVFFPETHYGWRAPQPWALRTAPLAAACIWERKARTLSSASCLWRWSLWSAALVAARVKTGRRTWGTWRRAWLNCKINHLAFFTQNLPQRPRMSVRSHLSDQKEGWRTRLTQVTGQMVLSKQTLTIENDIKGGWLIHIQSQHTKKTVM